MQSDKTIATDCATEGGEFLKLVKRAEERREEGVREWKGGEVRDAHRDIRDSGKRARDLCRRCCM